MVQTSAPNGMAMPTKSRMAWESLERTDLVLETFLDQQQIAMDELESFGHNMFEREQELEVYFLLGAQLHTKVPDLLVWWA